MKVLAFGEVLFDVFPEEEYIGGAPLNFALNMARHGETVHMLSALGNDALGKKALKILSENGINTQAVTLNDKETGKSIVTLNKDGTPSYELKTDAAWDFISLEPLTEDGFDVLYLDTLTLRGDENFNKARALLKNRSFSTVFADANVRHPFFRKEALLFITSVANILKISEEELSCVLSALEIFNTGSYEESLLSIKARFSNLDIIILTRGEDGALALFDGKFYSVDAVRCAVGSTVGAGDAFSAAFLHKYFHTGQVLGSMKYAAKVSSFVVSKTEAAPYYSPRDFV